MPIDRSATLENAEKLLRQGKIEPAIAEYLRLAEEQPRDWKIANTLGDLYVRAGKVDKAVDQFMRVADNLNAEGFLSKASAIYKKILKVKPEHEHALMQAAEIAGSLGLFVDARAYLARIIDRRQVRGDDRGAAQARIRLASLDPADFAGRIVAASARVELGEVAGATGDLKEIAAELVEKGRPADAIEALRQAAVLSPEDDEIRGHLLSAYLAAGDFARARDCASSPDRLKRLAAALEKGGHGDAALEALCQAERLEPGDGELRAHLARAFVARGDLQRAAQYLTVKTGDEPQLLLTMAETHLLGERPEDGLVIVRRLLDQYPERREEVALLAWRIAEQAPAQGFSVVELAADAAVASQNWASAAAAIQEFVTRVPNHIPALTHLVKICADGGLEATMNSAQAHLADAYITAGRAAEARRIAEDLVAREPWDRSNLERFRRALELLGEPDPDALIAERLSGQSPFMTTDLFLDAKEFSPGAPSAAPNPTDALSPDAQLATPTAAKSASHTDRDLFQVSAHTIDLEGVLGELEAPPAVAHLATEGVEVNSSIVLDDIKPPEKRPPAMAVAAPALAGGDLDAIFAQLRDDASRRSALDGTEHYKRGLALREAGDIEGCLKALQAASQAPALRFATASLLARILQDRGTTHQAIEWFERAAQAPAPSAEEGHALLYDLADALEKEGEMARALAIALELQAEAGGYRDVAARIDRLTKVQARG